MKVLDLFCGGGGATLGYQRAGYEVVGVDIDPQPHYPSTFIQTDAIQYIEDNTLSGRYDLVHASPPCQGYSNHVVSDGKWTYYSKGVNEARLIAVVRNVLEAQGVPYVIENVVGARDDLKNPVMLCGSMFDRPTPRHRLFETNWGLEAPEHPKCRGMAKRYAAEHGIDYRDMSVTGKSRRAGSIDTWRSIMDMPHAGRARDLSEAIFPAYTQYIGKEFTNEVHGVQ